MISIALLTSLVYYTEILHFLSPTPSLPPLSQNRPPRVKRFSARRLLKWLSGSDNQKTQAKTIKTRQAIGGSAHAHPTTLHTTSERRHSAMTPRRTTSVPSTTDPQSTELARQAAFANEISSTTMMSANKRASLPYKYAEKNIPGSGHKRRHSGGNISKSQVEGDWALSPAPPPSFVEGLGTHIRPFTVGMQKMINQDIPDTRNRSLSHPRSPSPHHPPPFGGKSLVTVHTHPSLYICIYMYMYLL